MKDTTFAKRILAICIVLSLCFALNPATSLAAAPPAPKGVKATAVKTTSVKLTWKKTSKAKSYTVYKKSGKKYIKAASTKKNYYTVKKLKPATKYTFKVAVKTAKGTSKLSKAVTVRTKSRAATPTPRPTPKPTPKPTPAPTKKPNIDPKIIGVWGTASVNSDYWDTSINDWQSGATYWCAYRFNADGTYVQIYGGSGSIIAGFGKITANYHTEGNKIYFTNTVGDYVDQKYGGRDSFTNRSYKDSVDYYMFKTNADGKLCIAIESDPANFESYPSWYEKLS